jgi:predicted ATP-grasp superfamily ATP-dependent carboligase
MLVADRREVELIEVLKELGPRLAQKAVLFPCNDPEVWLLSQHRNELAPWYHIGLPSEKIIEILLDKNRFYEYAETNNLPISRTFTSVCEEDIGRASSFAFPCIVKPPFRTAEWDRRVGKKGIIVADMEELERCCAQLRPWSSKLVVQEWISGGPSNLYACNCYFDRDSQPLVSFVTRKIRQWPHDTGISSSGEECRNDEVLEKTIALFTKIKYVGLAYLEMKRDTRTGRHVIIEPNIGRPTGRSALAEAGGVELLQTM